MADGRKLAAVDSKFAFRSVCVLKMSLPDIDGVYLEIHFAHDFSLIAFVTTFALLSLPFPLVLLLIS